MCADFRKEVFQLCKLLKNNEDAKSIHKLLYDLHVTVENPETGEVRNALHKNLAYVARNSRNQFHGYLFADDNADSLNLPIPLKVEHLSAEERRLVERGYKTIDRFIELCLGDLSATSPVIAWSINPYSKYREVKCERSAAALLTDSEMQNAVAAFKNGKVYKALVASNCHLILDKIRKEDMGGLMFTLERDISKGVLGEAPADLRELLMNTERRKDFPALLSEYSILIYALRESLALASQMLFDSVDGGRMISGLTVLNNDNIINIEKQESNRLAEVYTVLVQGLGFDDCGDIVLLDCEDRCGQHVHKFGKIMQITESISREFGETTRYTFAVVDDELIHIPNMTNHILNAGLPAVRLG